MPHPPRVSTSIGTGKYRRIWTKSTADDMYPKQFPQQTMHLCHLGKKRMMAKLTKEVMF